MDIVIWKIKSGRNPGLGIFLRGPPSDTGIDPEEVNRLYFLSQRKRRRGGMKEGEGKEESWKIQDFTELRNSPESKKRGLVEGGGMGRNWTVANCRNSTFRKSQPSFVEMLKKKKPFLVRKGRLFTSWKEETDPLWWDWSATLISSWLTNQQICSSKRYYVWRKLTYTPGYRINTKHSI